jgi:hypothetical protein
MALDRFVNFERFGSAMKHERNGEGLTLCPGKNFHFDSSTWRKITPRISALPSLPQGIFAFGHSWVLLSIIWAIFHGI